MKIMNDPNNEMDPLKKEFIITFGYEEGIPDFCRGNTCYVVYDPKKRKEKREYTLSSGPGQGIVLEGFSRTLAESKNPYL